VGAILFLWEFEVEGCTFYLVREHLRQNSTDFIILHREYLQQANSYTSIYNNIVAMELDASRNTYSLIIKGFRHVKIYARHIVSLSRDKDLWRSILGIRLAQMSSAMFLFRSRAII